MSVMDGIIPEVADHRYVCKFSTVILTAQHNMYYICSLVVSEDALGFGVGDVLVEAGMKKFTGAAVTVAMYNYT